MNMNTTKDTPRHVGLNIEIPAEVHRRAKAAAALADVTWNEACAEALDAWARAKGVPAPETTGSRR